MTARIKMRYSQPGRMHIGSPVLSRLAIFSAVVVLGCVIGLAGTPGVAHAAGPSVTSTSVSSDANPSEYGHVVAFTATVSGNNRFLFPTGTVTFMDGAANLGAAALSGGNATVSAALPAGQHNITAIYGGSDSYNPSTSQALIQTVNKGASYTSLTSSPNPSRPGQLVAFTATVSGDNRFLFPTGTVIFMDGAATLATAALSGGKATIRAGLTRGQHNISASYSGSDNYNPSVSATLGQTVILRVASFTQLASSANPSNLGQWVTFTATIGPRYPLLLPAGTVTFMDGRTTLGTATLSDGRAALSTKSLQSGPHQIMALYFGSPSYSPSRSAVLNQQVENTGFKVP